jgi:hypothetical protein
MTVYFDSFPALDAKELARFVNESDPGEADTCTIELAKDGEMNGLRLQAFAAQLGNFAMMIMVHSVPSPDREQIEESALNPEVKRKLMGHQAFALLTNMGGGDYAPYENLIFLYKVALGMCKQGATGILLPHVGICLPARAILGIHDSIAGDGTPGQTLWKVIREEGQPWLLFARSGRIETGGSNWLISRGFSFCGFPDILYKFEPGEDLSEITTFLENIFSYMMTNGPVIQAGHTMGHDKNIAFRFSDPPADLEFPFDVYDLLMVTRESVQKKKRFFGLF